MSSSSNQALIFLVLIALVVIVRVRRVINGTRVSTARTVGYTVFYLAFAAIFISSSYFFGVPLEFFLLDLLLLISGAFWAFRHAGRRLVFWERSHDAIFVKGATIIYLIYVAGLVARLAIEYIFIPQAFDFTSTAQSLSGTALIATVATDLLLSFGVGLLVGRNAQILKRYSRIRKGIESIPPSPEGDLEKS